MKPERGAVQGERSHFRSRGPSAQKSVQKCKKVRGLPYWRAAVSKCTELGKRLGQATLLVVFGVYL